MTTATSPKSLHPRRAPDSEDDHNRYYNGVAFASSDYVGWVIGRLRLGKADLGRMRTSGVPVLRSHQPDNVVGRVMRVGKSDGLWRSDWALPKIEANAVTFQQMDSAILRGVSVGGSLLMETLTIDNPDETNWDDLLLTCDWVLLEQSLTALPADVTSGVDRSLAVILERDGALFDTLISPEGIYTKDTAALRTHVGNLLRQHNEAIHNASIRRETLTTPALETPVIPAEAIERAIAAQLERSESLKALTQLPDKLDALTTETERLTKEQMALGHKMNTIQFQPSGPVLQLETWKAGVDPVLDLGKILRLTQTSDVGFPALDREATTLEESFLEQQELGTPARNTIARIPWEALAEREKQLSLQRVTMANAAGARPLDITVLGNAGLLLSAWAPILAQMDARFGVRGGQKLPWLTTQLTAAGGAEGADIAVSNLVFDNSEILPVSIASGYRMTSSLRAVDDGTFERVAMMAIFDVLNDQVTGQVLVGGGANEIAGLWATTGVVNVDYGAAQTDFDRDDALGVLNSVRLSKTDGMAPIMVASKGLWELMEKTPRGLAGTVGQGYTEVQRFVLDDIMYGANGGMMGPMGKVEGADAFYYADLAPAGVTDSGLVFKANRVVVWFWGDSLALEFVPQLARADDYKMVAECNMRVERPAENVSRIKQT